MKRLFDITLSLVLIALLSPLLLIVAILIKIDSPGPVLFRQLRTGLHGIPFTICKFRSMSVSQSGDAPYNTQPNDPRITRVGRLIRATSIDELPQLFNVLSGAMSIVGPRPDLPLMEKDYTPSDWRLRNSVKPGITGLAQVNGRSNISAADRLHYDLEYARNHGIAVDLSIMMKTFISVLSNRNTN